MKDFITKISTILSFGVLMFLSLFFFTNQASAFTIAKPPYLLGLTSGLVGWWTFDGKNITNGRADDVSGQGNHGNLVNIATSTFYTAGKIGQGFRFDGTDDYVTTNQALSTFISGSSGSISVWVKPIGTSPTITHSYDGQVIVGDTNGVSSYNYIQITRGTLSGQDRLWFGNYDGNQDNVGIPYTNNTWTHLVWIHSGGVLYAYSNGVLVSSTASGNTGSLADILVFGKAYGFSQSLPFNGSLDDVRIYNRALSQAEITQLYNLGAATKVNKTNVGGSALSSGLVGWWTFDGNKMITNVADSSSQGNNGLLIGQSATSTVPGKTGQALNFDGVNDYVKIGIDKIGTLINGSTAVTFSSWINYGTLSGGQYDNDIAVAWVNDSSSAIWVNIRNDVGNVGKLLVGGRSQGSDSFQETNSVNALNSGTWNHVAGVLNFTNDTITIYVNGIQSISTGVTFGSNTYVNGSKSTEPDTIGVNGTSNRYFPGKIDDVRIYNRALSQAEITQLYNLGAATKVNKTNVGGSALSSGLVGWWTFDGKNITNGRADDVSGNANHGNLVNIATSTFYTAGKIGQGFNFDGVNDYVSTTFVKSSGDGSLSVWFKGGSQSSDAGSAIRPIVAQGALNGSGAGEGLSISMLRNGHADHGKLIVQWGNGATQTTTNSTYNDNNWHQAILTHTSTTYTLYIDGVLNLTGTASDSLSTSPTLEVGGSSTNSARRFLGSADDVRIYNRALSQAEITQLYSLGR